HRRGGGQGGDLERQPGGAEQRAVVQQRAVPAQRETAPGRDQRRIVEREHHQAEDGGVQEEIPQPQRQAARGLVGPFHARPLCRASCWRTWLYWNSARGTSSNRTITHVTAEAMGQSALLKNSFHMTRPIIRVSAPPSISGMTYSPTDGMNTSMAPAITPGRDSGTVMRQNACQGRAPRS